MLQNWVRRRLLAVAGRPRRREAVEQAPPLQAVAAEQSAPPPHVSAPSAQPAVTPLLGAAAVALDSAPPTTAEHRAVLWLLNDNLNHALLPRNAAAVHPVSAKRRKPRAQRPWALPCAAEQALQPAGAAWLELRWRGQTPGQLRTSLRLASRRRRQQPVTLIAPACGSAVLAPAAAALVGWQLRGQTPVLTRLRCRRLTSAGRTACRIRPQQFQCQPGGSRLAILATQARSIAAHVHNFC